MAEVKANWHLEPKGRTAGIGSRRLPGEMSKLMWKAVFISVLTEGLSYSSGGAPGSDATTEHGVKAALKIVAGGDEAKYKDLVGKFLRVYLPGKFFNGRKSSDLGMVDASLLPMAEKAIELAREVHPAEDVTKPPKLPPYVLRLHARNGHQALGDNLSMPVRSILCYTPDGAKGATITSKTGGTGQALRLANKYSIPVINLGNDADRQKIEAWVEKRSKTLKAKGIDVDRECHDYYANFSAGLPHHIGDLLADSESLCLDLLVQGNNCFNTMGSGIAVALKEKYPEVYAADLQTKKGDKKKLGTYTSATVDNGKKPMTVINAYTQYNYGYDGKLYFDYSAFEKVLKTLNKEFPGARVGFPKIGAERAGGCWLTIAEMIRTHGYRLDPVIVSRPEDLEYNPNKKPEDNAPKKGPEQATLDI